MDLKNKTILLTGGVNGIGLELAKQLIKIGTKLIIIDINQPQKENRLKNTKYFSADISNSTEIKEIANIIDEKIEIIINNAGVMRRGELLESTEEDFDFLFNINVKGAWLILKYFQKNLKNTSTILQMSSRHGIYLPKTPALYALSKEMIASMGKIIDKTYPYTIKTLYPGPVNTQISTIQTTKKELEKKKKLMISPKELAIKIIELLKTNKKNLIFDEIKNEYYFE